MISHSSGHSTWYSVLIIDNKTIIAELALGEPSLSRHLLFLTKTSSIYSFLYVNSISVWTALVKCVTLAQNFSTANIVVSFGWPVICDRPFIPDHFHLLDGVVAQKRLNCTR